MDIIALLIEKEASVEIPAQAGWRDIQSIVQAGLACSRKVFENSGGH